MSSVKQSIKVNADRAKMVAGRAKYNAQSAGSRVAGRRHRKNLAKQFTRDLSERLAKNA